MIRSVQHLGMCVGDLDRSIQFYEGHLGFVLILRVSFDPPDYDAILGLDGARGEVALLELPSCGFKLELFEFAHPRPLADQQRPTPARIGLTHLCFEVDDADALHARLAARGIEFHCRPAQSKSGRATYGRDPDGNIFEIVTAVPKGKAPSDS
nr:VOC family protein [Sphingomonas sp. Y57]